MVDDLQAIVDELNQLVQSDDATHRIALCRRALALFGREDDPNLWADLQIVLGNNLSRNHLDNYRDHLDQAIHHYQQALEVYTHEEFPNDWAFIHHKLADAYRILPVSEKGENLTQAIFHYQQALEVYTHEGYPKTWATINANLALTFQLFGNQIDEREQAISYYKQALKVYTLQLFPQQWAIVQHNLGDIYRNRLVGDQGNNLEEAIFHYKQALQVYRQHDFPEEWASLHFKLAHLYVNRSIGKRSANLEQAIYHNHQALVVRTQETHPTQWANIHNNLATTYLYRIVGEHRANLELSLFHYAQALEAYNRQDHPKDWAMVQNNMGEAYRSRIVGERSTNLEQALHCFEQALRIRTHETMPEDWAMTQSNLGETYRYRITGERTINLEKSIHHLQQALTVLTADDFPEQWAKVQNNIAAAYRDRVAGRRSENLFQAIFHYQQALKILTRQTHSEQWAIIQQNLAIAYTDLSRIKYEPETYSEKALFHLNQALEVLTRPSFPVDWAMVQNNLGNIYIDRVVGERVENLEVAALHYQRALEVYTFEDFPEDWAMVQNNLGNVYADLVAYGQPTYLEQAIGAFRQALQVRTIEQFPGPHQQTQRNLGHLYFRESHWADAYAAYKNALAAGSLLYQASAATSSRQIELEATVTLAVNATYCLAKLGQFIQAVTILERSKTRNLNEVLTQREAVLEMVSVTDRADFTAVCQRIRDLEAEARAIGKESWGRDFLTVSADLGHARQELSAIVGHIRSYAPEFMPEGLDFPGIVTVSTTVSQPLVYLLTTIHGSLALMVPPTPETSLISETSAAFHIWLDDFKEDDLSYILYDQDGEKRYLHGALLGEIETLSQVLNEVGLNLHNKLLASVAGHLQASGYENAILIPAGLLNLLPLHALTADSMIFTLTPSARALQSALKLVQERKNLSPTLFGVGNPLPNPQPLSFARLEVAEIVPLFGDKHRALYEEQATREAVIEAAHGATYLHFSCHGAFNPNQPLDSAFYLAGDDTLTLHDLLDGRLDLSSARLAVLSACQTGITDFQNVPDEAIGFPTGFLQAGVPGVISTLWPVDEISTALLMMHFYRQHLEDGLPAAQALRQAQLWLQDVTAGELTDHFARKRRERRPNYEQVSAAWRRFAAMQPEEQPFAHPYYWAAFTFTGV
jgi:CHAT domain-containing protein